MGLFMAAGTRRTKTIAADWNWLQWRKRTFRTAH